MKHDVEEIKIRISGLSEGSREFEFAAEAADLGLDDSFNAPVHIHAELEKTGRQYYLIARIATSAQFTCDRCATGFEREVNAALAMVYVTDELEMGKFQPEEVRTIDPEAMYIDITDDVRQSILLSIPLKLLCRADCKGLCPTCGTDWNTGQCECDQAQVDSRFEKLKNLLKN
jgi:uncharacterized protein